MITFKKLLMVPAAALLMTAGVAQADRLSVDRVDEMLSVANEYGFTHFEEIEVRSRDSVEIEGWVDDEWKAEARLSLSNGEALREERERRISGAWGMSEEDVRGAFAVAASEGMVEFEEITINERGTIDIEGRDERNRELEVSLRQGSDSASHVDRD